jgi:transposase
MYLDKSKVTIKGKTYSRCLLRESFREKGKVKHRTIANLSQCSPEEIAAITLAFEHKHNLEALKRPVPLESLYATRQGPSVGAVAVLHGLACELGIAAALGNGRQGKLALWQVIARVIDQGSRLSAVRLATTHACCDLLGLDAFNEDHLYANLAWLTENQRDIELRLFQKSYPKTKPPLFLYDVTSSYLEGKNNELGAFGYNRDGKRGKMQIVIGLLCDGDGVALAIEVFAGNTLDPKTMPSQIKKVATQFGGGEVTFVGDRGMIKGPQIEELEKHGFHYITAITKPQIQSLLKSGLFQMSLFDQHLAEVIDREVRYVLRRNPRRAEEMKATRQSKLDALNKQVAESNAYLAGHPRGAVATRLKALRKRIGKLKLSSWVQVKQVASQRKVEWHLDALQREEEEKLDGCYVLKTDHMPEQVAKEVVHARYKDLALVEKAFRTSKTVELEMRPIHVRKEESTRGHALVVMLAYRLVQELALRWMDLDLTVGEGIKQLGTLCLTEVQSAGKVLCSSVPIPRPEVAELISRSGIALPMVIKRHGAKVATKKKLQNNRLTRS